MTRRTPRAPVTEEVPSAGGSFGEPPEPRTPRYDWPKIAARCKRKPGEWLLVFKQDRTTYATAVWQGSIAALRRSAGFESRTANNKRTHPRVCDLWVRYVPENDTTKKEK